MPEDDSAVEMAEIEAASVRCRGARTLVDGVDLEAHREKVVIECIKAMENRGRREPTSVLQSLRRTDDK